MDTDHDGNFSIRLPKGRSTIGISFMGFRTIECCLDIDSDMDSLIFTLQPEALNMDEVVVTATAVNSNKGTSVYRVDDQPGHQADSGYEPERYSVPASWKQDGSIRFHERAAGQPPLRSSFRRGKYWNLATYCK